MANLDSYQQMIEEILFDHASLRDPFHDAEFKVVVDRKSNEYLLLIVGWDGVKRLHACIAHVEIRDGKIWIQEDGTEEGIASELMARGIPKEQIVLGFHSADVRQYTGFAIA